MKKLLVTVFSTLAIAVTGAFSAYSQEYHEAALLDATGPVKEIIVNKVKCAVKKRTIPFLPSGKAEYSLSSFNEEGYPISNLAKVGKLSDTQTYTWNTDFTLAGIETVIHVLGNECVSTEFSYDNGERVPATEVVTYWKPADKGEVRKVTCKEEYSYSGYEYDSRGNWIARSVVLATTDYGKKNKTKTKEYRQTRTITYY